MKLPDYIESEIATHRDALRDRIDDMARHTARIAQEDGFNDGLRAAARIVATWGRPWDRVSLLDAFRDKCLNDAPLDIEGDHTHNWQEWTSADGTGAKIRICSLCPATERPVPACDPRDRIVTFVVELHHGVKADAGRFGRSWDCDVCLKAIDVLSGLAAR